MQFFYNNVVFLRHGETEWNLQNRTQGHLDSPLTERGVTQAREAVEKLKDHRFDVIVTSHLGRARETAKIIAEQLGISEIITDSALLERNLGILQGNIADESKIKFPYLFKDEILIHDAKIPDGELLEDFLARASKAIDNLKELSRKKNVLVVTHDGMLNAITSHIKGINFSEVGKTYQFKNCEPVIFS